MKLDQRIFKDKKSTLYVLEGLVTLGWLGISLPRFYPATLLFLLYLWFLVWVSVEKPHWLPAVLVACVTMEVSKQYIPILILPTRAAGFTVSLLDFFRLTQGALVLRWLFDFREKRIDLAYLRVKSLKKDALLWLPLALLGVYFLSTIFSVDVKHSVGESLRLISMMVTLYLSLPYLQEERDVKRFGYTLIGVGSLLGVIAIGEYLTGWFFFNVTPAVLINRRSNATFADPNILARFLVVTFLFTVAELERQDDWKRRLLMILAILLQGAGLGITGSRGGMLALGASMLVFAIIIPRRKFTISAMLLMGVAIVVAALANPVIMYRLESLSKGLLAASGGIREYLWRVGIAMVRDHPLIGVGIGGFGIAFTTIYSYFNPYSTFYVSLSHTAALTVLAETGLIGFTVFYFLFAKTLQRGWEIFRSGVSGCLRYFSAGTVAGVMAILMSAQGEGRLYEEPLLWLLWAVLVAVARLTLREQGKGRLDP